MATPVITFDKRTATSDGVDEITLSGIPLSSKVTLTYLGSGSEEEVVFSDLDFADTELILTFSEVGTYALCVDPPPYLSDEGIVDAILSYTVMLEAT